MTFTPGRDDWFPYAEDLIEHIEKHNCSLGCMVPSEPSKLEFGPGGDCGVLACVPAEIPTGDLSIIDGNRHKWIKCRARIPEPEVDEGQGTLDL